VLCTSRPTCPTPARSERICSPSRCISRSEIGRDQELQDVAYRTIGEPPVAALVAVIERWIARGEVSPDVPVALLAGIVPTAAFGSVMLRQRSLEPETVEQLVDAVLLPALGAPLHGQ
jgi:hypothetical protein